MLFITCRLVTCSVEPVLLCAVLIHQYLLAIFFHSYIYTPYKHNNHQTTSAAIVKINNIVLMWFDDAMDQIGDTPPPHTHTLVVYI